MLPAGVVCYFDGADGVLGVAGVVGAAPVVTPGDEFGRGAAGLVCAILEVGGVAVGPLAVCVVLLATFKP